MKYRTGIIPINSVIYLHNDMIIEGEGIDKTILLFTNSHCSSSMIKTQTSVNNIIISNLTINMNSNNSAIDLTIGNNTNIILQNIKIVNTSSSAIEISNSKNILIKNCIFKNLSNNAISIIDSFNINISCNKINNTSADAIFLKNVYKFNANNNDILQCGKRGIVLFGSSNGLITQNRIHYTRDVALIISNFETTSNCENIYCEYNEFSNIQLERLKEEDSDILFENIHICYNKFLNTKCCINIINLNIKHGINHIIIKQNNFVDSSSSIGNIVDVIYPNIKFNDKEWWINTQSIFTI